MNNNKIVIYIALITVIFVIIIPSVILVNQRHKDKLYNSINLKITEAAKKCYLEDKCQDEKIFLKTLYDYNYLDKQVNPYTKTYFSENSYVLNKKGKFKFYEA